MSRETGARKPLSQMDGTDFIGFLAGRGVAEREDCPSCGAPGQFGTASFYEAPSVGPLFDTDDPRLAEAAKLELAWSCDRCGFVRSYNLSPFIRWTEQP